PTSLKAGRDLRRRGPMKRWFRLLVVAATVQMLAAATLAVVHSPAVAWDRKYEGNPQAPSEGGPDYPGSGGSLTSPLSDQSRLPGPVFVGSGSHTPVFTLGAPTWIKWLVLKSLVLPRSHQ